MESYYLAKCKIELPNNLDSSDEDYYEVDRLRTLGDIFYDVSNKQGTAYLSFDDPNTKPLIAKLEWVYFQD